MIMMYYRWETASKGCVYVWSLWGIYTLVKKHKHSEETQRYVKVHAHKDINGL